MAKKQPSNRVPPGTPPSQKAPENRALSKKDKRRNKRNAYRTRVMQPES